MATPKFYPKGSTLHVEAKVMERNIVQIGKGLLAMQVPIENVEIIASFPPKIELGMRVKSTVPFYDSLTFKVIGLDGNEVWLKDEKSGSRFWANNNQCLIVE